MTEETGQAPNSESSPPESPKGAARSLAPVKFNYDIDILPDTRMPEYDAGEVKAYKAIGRDKANYFALVCERHLVPRSWATSSYAAMTNPLLVPLAGAGVVDWTPARQQRYVLVYRDVLGKRLLRGDAHGLGWRQDDVINIVVKPMVTVLNDFRNRDFVHGAIRPSNMFYAGNAPKPDKIMLGDCLSLPSSYEQPVLYQTIERGMVAPVARGEATLTDDLYAFGVSLAVFMRSSDAIEKMTDDDIIRAKIEFGSYGAITGGERFKGSILELLRGVLHDDQAQRWTLDEIMAWLDGRRLSPKQSLKEKKAPRPVLFSGEKYYQSRILAMNFDKNPPDVVRLVESDDLQQWLERSLEDDVVLERMTNGIKAAREKGIGPGYEDRLAATLSIALDPYAPLRYRGLHMTGDGVGKALGRAMVLKQDIQPYADLFTQNIAFNWVTVQENHHLDTGSLISRFDNCRSFVRHGKTGYGIERCLYLLCPEINCLSEKILNYYVTTPEEMILAFEELCRSGKAPAMFLDRHSAAFLSVKDPKVIDSHLFDIASSEDHKKILGNLRCLATIQKRSSMPPFPGIAQAFMDVSETLCQRYHDREVRARLQKSMAKFAVEGDLTKMAEIFNNADILARDMSGFRAAMNEYAALRDEDEQLEISLADQANFGRTTGHEVAAIVSSIIAAIAILTISFMFYSKPVVF